MKDDSEYGKSINLGVEFNIFTQELPDAYKTIDMSVDYINRFGENIFSAIIDKIIEKSDKNFFVPEKSRYILLLQSYIKSGKVIVCNGLDSFFSKQDSFVFIDESDEDFIKNLELLSVYSEVPAWMITTRKIVMIIAFFDELLKLSKKLETVKQHSPKDIYLLSLSNKEYILGGILLLLCKKIKGIVFHQARMMGNKNPLDYNIYNLVECGIHKKISCIILNCFGSLDRAFLTYNTKITYYFVYGEKKVQSNRCHEMSPFFLWLYPHAGTGRVVPVFELVTKFLGINQSRGVYSFYDTYFKRSVTDVSETDFQQNLDTIINIFKVLPANSMIALHDSAYDAEKLINETHAKMIIVTRDMRDIVLSNINWFYGARIKFGGENFEDIAIDFMESKHAYPCSGHGSYTGGTDFVTKKLVNIATNKDVFLLRFEDVHEHGVSAYMKFFEKFGFTKDPYWVDELIIPRLKEKVYQSNPHNHNKIDEKGRGYSLQHAQPNGWKKYFTPKMKEYFKQHDNNILEIFGYEQDKNWGS